MTDINREQIEQLVMRPAESLVIEIKTWISPKDPAGQAKIVKAAIALRNRGGGYLVIGLNDETHRADSAGAPEDPRSVFHVDVIQGLVTKYASETFEIRVEFVESEGSILPVIVIPPGVRTPVCSKAQLTGDGGKVLVERDAVYVRTLNSNNTPSTAKAQWKDWNDLVEICFDNREADIGRFLRRHLAGSSSSALREFTLAITDEAPKQDSTLDRLTKVMEQGLTRFRDITAERSLDLPRHGSWEVTMIIDGGFSAQHSMEQFGNLLSSSNPSYTGWPVWLNSRTFSDPEQRPYVMDGAWESYIVALDPSSFVHIDFMRESPDGQFYSYRALEDDIPWSKRAPAAMTVLDGILPVLRVSEAIAVGLAFARSLNAAQQTTLEFLFRWTGLKGRTLASWANPGRHISPRVSQQNVVLSNVSVPFDAAPSALAEYVKAATRPLFEVFEGFSFPEAVVDELTQKLLERRL